MHTNLFRAAIAAFQIWLLVLSISALAPAQRVKAPETVISNTTSIGITAGGTGPAPTVADLYPSPVTVSGMTGTITRVAVTVNGVSHFNLADLDMLLVSPTGAKYIFLADGGGNQSVADRVWTFADDGSATIPVNVDPPSGTYKPTSGDSIADTFPSPAPAGPYNQPTAATFASTFNGAAPNGVWSLYVVDDTLNNPGGINSGWSLTITTDGAPTTFANSSYIGIPDIYRASNPYGTPITVSGQTGAIANLKVSLNGLTTTNPQGVDMLLVSPNGKGLLLMSDAGSSASVSNVNLTFDDAAANLLPFGQITSGTYRPADYSGSIDYFPNPAPLAPYHSNNAALSNFYGFSPNGDWRLFVTSSSSSTSGTIAGGWSLDITMGPIPTLPPASCSAAAFTPTNFGVGTNPTNVAVADFNGDNKLDLAVTNQVSNDVSILLGNGNGTFQPQTLLAPGSGPYSIVAGKFNADNNMDLAVANSGSNNVSIFLGNGNGTFSAPTNYFVGANPISIATADFNNDGKQDLIVANFGSFFSGTVSVLLGNGSGGFTAGTTIRTRTQPAYVMAANLNNDGNMDVIVANFGSDSVTTFMGVGNGTFQLNQNITTGAGPVAVELADISGDGIPDLMVANYNADTVTTCSGQANGSFVSCSINNPAGGANPISIAAADFLGTGVKTYGTAMSGSNLVRVVTSNVAVGQSPNAIRVGDFNGDGKMDIVSVNSGSNDVSVMINGCQVAKGNIFDFDGDRRTDYAVYRPASSQWFNQSLNPSQSAAKFGRPTDILAPADYNGDRLTEMALYRPESGLWIVQDRFGRPVYFTQFGLPQDIPVPADYDGDGKADIAVWRPTDGNWYIRQSSDNSLRVATFGSAGDKPVAADFDGDGKDDLAIYRPSTGVWYIWRSSDNQFMIRQFGVSEDKPVVGDYDGDGKADIAVWRPSTGVWYVLRSTDGGFSAVGWGMTGDVPVVGDFEGDGKYDFAIWRPTDQTWYIRKSSDGGAIYYPWGLSSDQPLPNAFVR